MKKVIFVFGIFVLFVSCQTIDVEKTLKEDLASENEKLSEENKALKEELSVYAKEEEYTYDIEPYVYESKQYIVIDKSEYEKVKNEAPTGKDAVSQSLKDSFVTLEEWVGGTSYYDYDENRQFPVFTKELALTTIVLNDDEVMEENKPFFMSDSLRWDVTGDVWETEKGNRQLIFIKPKAVGLETNMVVVTSKRIYHFILYSQKKDYQPMIRFRYPYEKPFITSHTKHVKAEKTGEHTTEIDPSLVSWNYKITVPFFSRKVDWVPEIVYDDGSHTYILIPEVALQKELPAAWEGKNEITNYEWDGKIHNLLIINKLIEKVTLRIGNKKVYITKKRGERGLSIKRG